MTDHEVLNETLSRIDPSAAGMSVVRRKGRILLALPSAREPAARALALYQPQRRAARCMARALRGLTALGLQRLALHEYAIHARPLDLSPALRGVEPGSCGILLGSPEHRIRRAIASYRLGGRWEVAKIFFGAEGKRALEREAEALGEIHAVTGGAPELLGLHHDDDVTVLRMPYLEGDPMPAGRHAAALRLQEEWMAGSAVRPINSFPEWPFIESALEINPDAGLVRDALSRESLVPAICHGDFARWNLRSPAEGSLMALDWEWGHTGGMPGIDLVHYFLQDHRLVRRKRPEDAIRATLADLNRPECSDYLRKTGWQDHGILALIACLAWKQGAGHQENSEFLRAAVAMFRDR